MTSGAKVKRVFLQLFSEADGYLISHQVEETRTALPVFVVLHFLASLAVLNLAWGQASPQILLAWGGLSLLFGVLLIVGFVWMRRKQGNVRSARLAARLGFCLALGLCLNWEWASFGFGAFKSSPAFGLIEALQVVVMVVGLLCSLRLPVTALLFVLALISDLFVKATIAHGYFSASVALISLLGFATMTSAVFALGLSMRRRWALEKYRKRDAEIIKLLLHDMGSEIRDWMWETDSDGRLVSHSPNLPSVLHEIPGSLTGRKFLEEVFAIQTPELMPRFAAQDTLTDENFETQIAGELRQWNLSAKPLFDATGSFIGYRGVSRDVTALAICNS